MNNGDRPAMPLRADALYQETGLTKRQAFAMAAMQGLICADDGFPETRTEAAEMLQIEASEYSYEVHWPQITAKRAVNHADALLAALEQEQ